MSDAPSNSRRSLIDNEKQVFQNAIHAQRTYFNKKKKSSNILSKDTLKFNDLSGSLYPPLTIMDQERRSACKVEEWLQKHSPSALRAPFADLDPNIEHSFVANKRRCLRSATSIVDRENDISSYIDLKSINSPKKTLKTKEKTNDKHLKKADIKRNYIIVKNNAKDEDISTDQSTTQTSNETIKIEDKHEKDLDKDGLAYLEVLRIEKEREAKIKAQSEDDDKAREFLQSLIESLRVDISKLEGEIRLQLPLVKGQIRLWSERSLSKVLCNDIKEIKHFFKLEKTSTQHENDNITSRLYKAKINKSRNQYLKAKAPLKKRKDLKRRAGLKIVYVARRSPKMETIDSAVQTDFSCFCFDKSALPPPYLAHNNTEDGIENCIGGIDSRNIKLDDKIIELTEKKFGESEPSHHSKNEKNCDSSDSDESAHKLSGIHNIKVQYHAPIDLLDSDYDDDVAKNIPLKIIDSCNTSTKSGSSSSNFQTANEESPPAFWMALDHTPTKQSPTYTLTPPSNSSSNKENYAPWRTPSDDNVLNESKKNEKESFNTRNPLSLLFEEPSLTIHVSCSRLNNAQINMIQYLCARMGWVYYDEYRAELTHLVVSDQDNKAERTLKYMSAVAAGCWVVSSRWVEQCVLEGCHVDEETFELLDASGEPGPMLSRVSSVRLLTGITCCVLPTLTIVPPEVFTSVLVAAGARIVLPSQLEGNALVSHVIVLYQPSDDDNIQTFEEISSSWKVTAVLMVYEWVVESIARHRLLPPHPYALAASEPTDDISWLHQLCCQREPESQ